MTFFLPLWAEFMSFLAAEAHVHDMFQGCFVFLRTESVDFEKRWKVSASWELTHWKPFNTGPTIINDLNRICELHKNQSNILIYEMRYFGSCCMQLNWTHTAVWTRHCDTSKQLMTLLSWVTNWIILTENHLSQWINLQRFKESLG